MIFIRYYIAVFICILISLFLAIPVIAQEDTAKTSIVIVPLEGKDVPSYIPMIVERLFAAKIDKTNAYFIFDREIFTKLLIDNDIELPKIINDSIALEIG